MTGTTPSDERVPIQPFFDDLKKHLKKTTADSLKANKKPEQIHAVAETVMDAFSSSVVGLEKLVPPDKPIACKKGCAHCCHLAVMTDGATVLRIAEFIRENVSSAQRTLLDMRLILYEDKVEKMTQSQRSTARIPCPLLVDGACSVHEVRPLICRAFNSFDAEICDRKIHSGGSTSEIPSWDMPWLLGLALESGLKEALEESGYADGDIELGLGLKAALDHSQPDERWLAGDRIFAKSAWKARKP